MLFLFVLSSYLCTQHVPKFLVLVTGFLCLFDVPLKKCVHTFMNKYMEFDIVMMESCHVCFQNQGIQGERYIHTQQSHLHSLCTTLNVAPNKA